MLVPCDVSVPAGPAKCYSPHAGITSIYVSKSSTCKCECKECLILQWQSHVSAVSHCSYSVMCLCHIQSCVGRIPFVIQSCVFVSLRMFSHAWAVSHYYRRLGVQHRRCRDRESKPGLSPETLRVLNNCCSGHGGGQSSCTSL